MIFRVIFAGEVITSRSLDARVEILQANGTIDNTKLREAIQSIGETVRTVASVPPNAAVLLIQSGAARSLIRPNSNDPFVHRRKQMELFSSDGANGNRY